MDILGWLWWLVSTLFTAILSVLWFLISWLGVGPPTDRFAGGSDLFPQIRLAAGSRRNLEAEPFIRWLLRRLDQSS